MNFVEICRLVRAECGIPGNATTPASVVNQYGELGRVVNWTREAWVQIQRHRKDWQFMNVDFDGSLLTGTNIVDLTALPAPVTDVARWDPRSVRISLASANLASEANIPFIAYDVFRASYMIGPMMVGLPTAFTINRAGMIEFNAVPDVVLRMRASYYRTAQVLTADNDIPICPEDYHHVIMWQAVVLYARHEEAGNDYTSAIREYKKAMGDLLRAQLPEMSFGAPLA